MDIRGGILSTAAALGMDPVDLATVISYETAGTFDPTKKGPTTQWGQHRGLIQFGQPQAKEYGVDWNDPLGSQLGPDGAVAKYFKANGYEPGMGLLDAYSIVNAGGPGRYNRSDANNGGAPGSVADKVNNQMAGHRAKAARLIGEDQAIANDAMAAIGKAPVQPTFSTSGGSTTAIGGSGADTMAEPSGLLGKFARTEDNVGGLLGMMFKNMTPDRADSIRAGLAGMQGISNQGVYNAAQGRMQGRRDADSWERGYEHDQSMQQQRIDAQSAERNQQMQAEAQRRESARQWVAQNAPEQLGAFDSGVIGVDEVYKAAQPPETYRQVSGADLGMTGEDAGKMFNVGPDGKITGIGGGGTTVQIGDGNPGLGKLSTDYAYVIDPATGKPAVDPETNMAIARPVPGSPAAQEIEAREAKQAAAQETAAETEVTRGDVVMKTVNSLRDKIQSKGIFDLPEVGVIGSRLTGVNQEAADVAGELQTLKGMVVFDRLEQLKRASENGSSGLGQVTEVEIGLLGAQLGALDQSLSGPKILETLDTIESVFGKLSPEALAYLTGASDEIPTDGGTAPAPAPTGDGPKRLKFNPETGRIE